jgi:uncharacterized membrane protein
MSGAVVSPSLPSRTYRVDSIDLLRGLVMIIMALDHTRENFYAEGLSGDPLNLQSTTPLLFFTRWITHFCAPVFVFLSGASIYLQSQRKSRKELSSFLLKRGLWLIFVDLVLMSLALTFDVSFGFLVLQVIWAIGISMVLLSLLIRLPYVALLALGIIIVGGHNLLDSYDAPRRGSLHPLYMLVHVPGIVPLGKDHVLAILYPFLPWTGVMLLGYCFGRLYRQEAQKRTKKILALGLGDVIVFILLRYTNAYGDPLHWSPQKSGFYTALSFINTQKYPPSLLFICMTLGPALIFLALFDSVKGRLTRFITVYGRVPFFYYILHFYALHLGTAVLFLARGHSFKEGVEGTPNFPFHFLVPGEGVNLFATYCIWIGLVLLLYPLCKWFARYKQTHRQWWLSYL